MSLDGRIELDKVKDKKAKMSVFEWLNEAGEKLLLPKTTLKNLKGVVFEVRQGYKSKDSKRQNADISNASNAYANLYLPTLFLLSTQIDEGVASRYTKAQWLLLNGTTNGSAVESSYVFCRNVIGYDLAEFFERNSEKIRKEIVQILTSLLKAD